ncbi:YhcH/YjgK/YiaL family protein [Cellulosilyticum sp. I15G10I2]|uniref:YhcH/YjgK/YiaL family protein n=1 Tax=Cellulosilyticum sp. I15G10I2 TaxID=1892843 RepID=UPI00085BB77F|nr:YhcH/YjgK/YiaL family protein [Cellulosilyticum sp. I15G10I2]
MIYSSIHSTFDIQKYPKVIKDAVEFFKKTDFKEFEEGEYEIAGKDIFFQVKDIMTLPVSQTRAEIHRKYIDVQFLYRGKESIGVVDDTGLNEVDEDFLEERDILFYKNVPDETFITMNEGDFCVFFPSDVHRPACERNGKSMIRKIVYKIHVNLLQ